VLGDRIITVPDATTYDFASYVEGFGGFDEWGS
jgi:hypothetical protein